MFRHPKTPLIAGIVMISALAAYLTLYRSSPGPLSQAHHKVAGSSFIGDCNKCHAKRDIAAGCLGCHEEIRGQLDRKTGLHSRLLAGKKVECARCHSEHHGPDFALVNRVSWGGQEPARFRHDPELRLKGKHSSLDCADCHEKHAPPFALPRFPALPRARTFLGLAQDCSSCHKDPHASGLAADCAACHSQDAWKPAPLFRHDKYPLEKGHERRKCAACHILPAPGQAAPRPLPKGFPFDRIKGKRCADCHQSPHKARWAQDCEKCHTESAVPWAEAGAKMTPALHQVSGFRILPSHRKTACAKCHDPKLSYALRYAHPATGRARSEKACELCHRDEHRGQFAVKHPRCADCHSLEAFKPAVYPASQHKTYKLEGRHLKAACDSCHVKDPRTGARRYSGSPTDCAACHADAHAGQFLAQGRNRCEACHLDPGSWKTLVFDHDRQSRYKLDTAHKEVACRECHPLVSLRDGRRLTQYKPIGTKCTDCHELTPH